MCRVGLALLVGALASCDCGPAVTSAEAELQVAPASLDFGTRSAGSRTTLSFELTNTGAASLFVHRIVIEDDARGAFTLGTLPARLAPEESATLSITYAAPSVESADRATLRIASSARATPDLQLPLVGRSVVVAPLDAGVDAGADAGTVDAGAEDSGVDAGRPSEDERDAGPQPGGCRPPILTGSTSVTYQINLAHTGAQPGDQLRLPLCRRWQRELGGPAGFPVVTGGRVFVVSRNDPGYGDRLWALDQFTGAVLWGPVDLGGNAFWAALAYDADRLFAVNSDGFLRAFDPATGALFWARQLPGQYFCSSAPTATGGMVYTSASGSAGTFYGLWASDGGVRWSQTVANGEMSSPAVSAGGVYASYACNQAYAFDPTTGTQRWHAQASCQGAGGKTVALHRGRVYTRDVNGNLVLDAATGAVLDTYRSTFIPALSGDLALLTPSNALRGFDLDAGGIAWAFDAGGESIVTAPLIVGSHAVAATESRLIVVNLSDGTLASSFAVTQVLGPNEQSSVWPLAGLAVADGMLFVPVGTGVEAW